MKNEESEYLGGKMDSVLDLKGHGEIKVEVSDFNESVRVDFRKWYQDKQSGEWKRTGKGLNLSLDEFNSLKEQFEDICEYVSDMSEEL